MSVIGRIIVVKMLIELLAQRLFGVSFPTFFIVVFKVAAALFMGLMTLL
jgi:hypothetical protein